MICLISIISLVSKSYINIVIFIANIGIRYKIYNANNLLFLEKAIKSVY